MSNNSADNADDSGIFCVFEEKPRTNAMTSPYLPEITRAAFSRLERKMEEMKDFFTNVFYYQLDQSPRERKIFDKMQHLLFNGQISDEECFVGHRNDRCDDINDQLILSTPRSLVLFDCEPQKFTKKHPAPQYSSAKLIHPDDGLFINPRGNVFTSNFGPVRFDEDQVYETRRYPNTWGDRDEKALWEEHVVRWDLDPFAVLPEAQPYPQFIRKGFRATVLDILHWNKRDQVPNELSVPVTISYEEFQRRLQDITFTLKSALEMVDYFIEKEKAEDHSEND